MEQEVTAWTSEAFRTLEKARLLLALAQAVLESTNHILAVQLPKRLDLAESELNHIKNLHANVTALVEHVRAKVEDGIIASYTAAVGSRLVPAISGLEAALKLLDTAEVPLYVVNGTNGARKHVLGDFVARDVIETLLVNVSVFRGNCERTVSLLAEQLAKLLETAHRNNQKLVKCTKTYDSQVADVQMIMRYAFSPASLPRSSSNLVRAILKENSSLELELASLLAMLTNHYDQCVMAQNLMRDSGAAVDVDVLRNDALELPGVLKEFGSIHDIIMNNESRAAKFVDLKLPHVDSVILQCSELVESYTTFKDTDFVRFVLVMVQCEKIMRHNSVDAHVSSGKESVDAYVDVISQLTYHYTQFHSVYHLKYVTELHYEQYVYPRRFLKILQDFLNGTLLQVEEEERTRRHHWLQKYGSFIPKEFVLPGEYNQPSVVQVISEGLDEIQASSAVESEARLLALIKQLRELKVEQA